MPSDEERPSSNTAPSPAKRVVTSRQRRRSIEGVVSGVAVGEALGLQHNGLSRRKLLWMQRGSRVRFRFLRWGIPAAGYHGLLSTGQAVLRSFQDGDRFAHEIAKRQVSYSLTSPFLVGFGAWFNSLMRLAGVGNRINIPVPRCHLLPAQLLLGVVLKSNVSGSRWNESTLRSLYDANEFGCVAKLLANAAQWAAASQRERIDRRQVWQDLKRGVDDEVLASMMEQMTEYVARGRTLAAVARAMGWRKGVPKSARAIALIAIYGWLRHPKRFRQAIVPAVCLGGEVAAVGAIVGGLAGISLGGKQIPPEWRNRVLTWPHRESWHRHFVDRLSEWPHGIDDLHDAPALSSQPIRQILRNALVQKLVLSRFLFRLLFSWKRL